MMTDKDKNLTLIENLARELAQHDAEHALDRPETPEEKAEIDRLDANARALLQRLRREAFEEIRRTRPAPAPRSLPARILTMTREAIVERLRALQAQSPVEFQAAYRKLDDLGIEELRVTLADLEEALGVAEEP